MNIVFCNRRIQVVERSHNVLNVPTKKRHVCPQTIGQNWRYGATGGAEKCYPPDGQKERTRSDLALEVSFTHGIIRISS